MTWTCDGRLVARRDEAFDHVDGRFAYTFLWRKSKKGAGVPIRILDLERGVTTEARLPPPPKGAELAAREQWARLRGFGPKLVAVYWTRAVEELTYFFDPHRSRLGKRAR